MPPPLTVKDARTTELNRVQAALVARQQELLDADADLVLRQEGFAVAQATLSNLEAKASTLRQQITSPATMPSDVHAFEVELEATIALGRQARAALADAQDALGQAVRKRQRLAAMTDRLKAQVAEAEAAVALARADDTLAARWRTAINGALKATRTAAAAPPAQDQIAAAKAKLAAVLGGQPMYELMRSRLAAATAEATERVRAAERAADALDALHKVEGPPAGTVAMTGTKYARVRNEVASAVDGSAVALEAALQALQAATVTTFLTPAEQAEVTARAAAVTNTVDPTDPTKTIPSAAKLETDVNDAVAPAREAFHKFEAKALVSKAQDPAFNAETAASINAERTARNTTATALSTARALLTQPVRTTIEVWEVAVPESAMALVLVTLQAIAAVERIKSLKLDEAGGLLERLDKAEDDYAKALKAGDEARVRREDAAARVAERLDALATIEPVAEERLAAAVRGDR